jgi:hypothetical protein
MNQHHLVVKPVQTLTAPLYCCCLHAFSVTVYVFRRREPISAETIVWLFFLEIQLVNESFQGAYDIAEFC